MASQKAWAAAGLEADSLLIIFTLAALPPKDQHTMLSNAFKVSTAHPERVRPCLSAARA